MLRRDFFDFLSVSLDVIENEAPGSFHALAREVDGLLARLVADGDARIVCCDAARFAVVEDMSEPDIEVAFEREGILNLIDGKSTLEGAFYGEALRIRGDVEIVERFHEGLQLYLAGAIRSTSMPALLAQFRGSAAA